VLVGQNKKDFEMGERWEAGGGQNVGGLQGGWRFGRGMGRRAARTRTLSGEEYLSLSEKEGSRHAERREGLGSGKTFN